MHIYFHLSQVLSGGTPVTGPRSLPGWGLPRWGEVPQSCPRGTPGHGIPSVRPGWGSSPGQDWGTPGQVRMEHPLPGQDGVPPSQVRMGYSPVQDWGTPTERLHLDRLCCRRYASQLRVTTYIIHPK